MPSFSILIPHKRDPENDKALRIALDCIAANTLNDYELMVDTTTPADPYVCINSMAERAASDYIFLSNSDIFVSPNWDVDLLAKANPTTIVNATLVEPGAIGVHEANIHRSFGMRPETFDRIAFEQYVASNPELPAGNGFVYYALIHREMFLGKGGFDLSRGHFPEPLDRYFFDQWESDGLDIVRARSYIFHLQNWSNPLEQQKSVRHT